MKIIDIYIIKKFLGTFFFAIALIISIAIVFDISEQLEDFIQKEAPLREIVVDYYFNFIPYFINLFSPLFVFISVIFFTSKMSYNSELIAILTSGVSFRRLMFPFFVSALFLAAFSYALGNFVIPRANKMRYEFQKRYIWNAAHTEDRNIHKQVAPGIYIYMDSYNAANNTGYQFSIERFENGKLASKLMADFVVWDTTKNKWQAHNYYIRNIYDDYESLTRGAEIDTSLKITPEEFTRRNEEVEALDYFELNDYIAEQQLRGASKVVVYLVEKYKRIAFPFSTFILTLIGVAVASRKAKGGIGLHIGIGLTISFSYILFMQVSSTFAINGNMNPILAVWIPNILFLLFGILLYKAAPK
ncbi:MAG: LptF/LptG family permease [Bacteroidia bacterium]|nr:LptF/LptG family permease [Bacteroidia bacterium]